MLLARLRTLGTSLLGASAPAPVGVGCGAMSSHAWAPLIPSSIRSLATKTLLPPPLAWRTAPPPPGTMPRAEKITLDHIGQTFLVHSGKEFRRVKVSLPMVDHKFGEFVLTRKRRPPPPKKTARGGKKK